MTDTARPVLSLKKTEQPPKKVAENEVFIELSKLKVTLPLKPEQLPESVLPPEGKGGNVVISLQLADESNKPMVFQATLNAKNYRKVLKTIKEKEAEGLETIVLFQGNLTPNRTIEGGGLTVTVKQPKPDPT